MKAIIFDFDGTLADSGECGLLATQKAFEECNLPIPTKEIVDYYMGIPIEQSFHEMTNHTLNDESFSELLQRFRQAYKTFEEQTITAFPQIDEVLKTLGKNGIMTFVVSSKKTDVLYRNLQKLQLDQHLTDWIGSDQVEHYKPHPDGILKIVERYSLDVNDCVMVGDAIFDIQMGKSAGCKTVAVNWGSHSKDQLLNEEPSYFANEVSDLFRIFNL
ncbi:HAD family hydrolase [Ureibacillus acetophenoni]|uniref:HAD superfamily hydrolase (TIGR01509 family)/HAD superfamily hydrolase (TIGR01549 family) n=1 Tax=Ureibacillus acetophenoni TaxID=614649 RepID=A0A285UL92_9BACL|nr:HAD family hydrolase [Ureibacillus acetophenoni]SOC42619.1 HAD superfamily hydrolase (TIGR01509 family)/HAD superfamily hydrolase (TIGR01549 family) [Ureibacillus acetophenoni]